MGGRHTTAASSRVVGAWSHRFGDGKLESSWRAVALRGEGFQQIENAVADAADRGDDDAAHRLIIVGDAESDALIKELTDHTVATPAQYRHKWAVGDIVIWDNRCALHSATGGYPIDEQRIHWRVTIMQDTAQAQKAA